MVHIYPQRACLDGLVQDIFKIVSYSADPRQWGDWLRVPLEHAAARGNLSLVDMLLEAGADGGAGWKGCGGRTSLHAAALGGSEGVVSSLLLAGAQPDVNVMSASSTRRSALYVAAKCGHEDAARTLLLAGADPSFDDPIDKGTVLHEAVDSGHEQLVSDLLAAGACPNARSAGQEGYTPLHLAASRGSLGILSALFAFGADKDALDNRGALPMHHAISQDNVGAMDSLLAAGADPMAGGGLKPVFLAAATGKTEGLKVLFKHGVDVNFRDSTVGLTALHAAVSASTSDGKAATAATIHALVDEGAKVDVQRLDGGAPLHFAAVFAIGSLSRDYTLALLQRGASVNLTHIITSQTPLHVACQHQRPGVDVVVDLLLRWGANEQALDGNSKTALDLLDLNIHGDSSATFADNCFSGGRRGLRCSAHMEEVSRARTLLARAKEDRAWRRRRLPVILRWRKQCTLQAGAIAPSTAASCLGVVSEADEAKVVEANEVIALEEKPLSLENDGEGGEIEASIDEGRWGRVIAALVGLASEELFRTIVGFL